jgi:two-component sensor histidine kinase
MPSVGTPLRDAGHRPSVLPVRRYARVFMAQLDQVRAVRRFIADVLPGCPAVREVALCLSELAANAVVHSASSRPGGAFAVRAEILDGSYVRIEVHDDGGPWRRRAPDDSRPHGLDIVAILAAESGVDGSALSGWISWATLSWSG